MRHLSYIIKGKNVPEFTQREVELYKRTFDKVHLPHQKVEEICNKVRIHYEKSNGL